MATDHTYIPGASLPENRMTFTVQNGEGEECTFNIPRRGYLTRGQVKSMDKWGEKNPAASTADLFVQIVKIFDTEASKFLDGDSIEVQQIISMWGAYEANEKVTLGESSDSSDS